MPSLTQAATRREAIRRYCQECAGDDLRSCDAVSCVLWRYRKGREVAAPGQRLTRGQAIRKRCVECMAGQRRLVAECPSEGCHLWPYRS